MKIVHDDNCDRDGNHDADGPESESSDVSANSTSNNVLTQQDKDKRATRLEKTTVKPKKLRNDMRRIRMMNIIKQTQNGTQGL